MKKIHSQITEGVFFATIFMGLYTLYNIFLSNRNLPAGVCPAESHQVKITVTILLAAAYLIMTLFAKEKSENA